MSLLKQYRGAVLLATNLSLLLIIVFGQNALSLFKTGYAGADPIIDLNEKNIASIKIIDPDNHGTTIELIRTPKVRKIEDAKSTDSQDIKPAFEWDVTLSNTSTNGGIQKHKADAERLKSLLEGLQNTRDYYGITRSAGKDVELEMSSDSTGNYKGLQIIVQKFDSSKKYTLYVGKTNARGSQSYARLNNEDKIFLVETNLRSITGSGETDYFRNRKVFSQKIKVENISMLDASFAVTNQKVQLSKQAKEWNITVPFQKPADTSKVSSLLRDIINWKANKFYNALPKDHDVSSLLSITLYYNHKGNLTDQLSQSFVAYSKKAQGSNYYIQLKGQKNWIEISSIYLEDLKSPIVKFSKQKQMRLPGADHLQ